MIAKSESIAEEVLAQSLQEILKLFAEYHAKFANMSDPHVTWTEFNKYNRMNKMLDRIADILGKDYQQLVKDIQESTHATYLEEFMALMFLLEMTQDEQMTFTIPTPNTIQKALDQPIDKIKLKPTLQKQRNATLERLRVTIANGLLAGNSYNDIADEITKNMNMSQRQARLVARTEGGRSQSQAQVDAEEVAKSNGVKITAYWDATLDLRTRPSHQKADGMRTDENGMFRVGKCIGPAPRLLVGVDSAKQNIQCRCQKLYLIGGKKPDVRQARNEENKSRLIPYLTYSEWYKLKMQE